jgi:hypothetical protein
MTGMKATLRGDDALVYCVLMWVFVAWAWLLPEPPPPKPQVIFKQQVAVPRGVSFTPIPTPEPKITR